MIKFRDMLDRIKARIFRGEKHIGGNAVRGRIFKRSKPEPGYGPKGRLAVGKGKLTLKAKITRVNGNIEEIDLA